MKTPIIPTKVDPQMMDPAMIELTGALTKNLPWLDKAYANVETFVESKGRKKHTYPAVYTGTKRDRGYIRLLPDSHIGNFAYIEVNRQDMEHVPQQSATHWINFSIVFWFNFEKVYPDDHKNRTLENVKHDVFAVLNRYPFSRFSCRFEGFVEGSNQIYRGYSHDEIEDQFLMRPYGGFKINGRMRFVKKCGGSDGIVILPPSPSASSLTMYSIEEAKTGLKDYDGTDIYVAGKQFTDADIVQTIGGPMNKIDSGISADGKTVIRHEFIGIVNGVEIYQPQYPIVNDGNFLWPIPDEFEVSANGRWFIYYKKNG